VYDAGMGEQRHRFVTAADFGEQHIDVRTFTATWGRQPRCRWRVTGTDSRTEHQVTAGALPEGHPAGRWYVDSTHHADASAWAYPTTAGALWRLEQLRRQRPEYVWEEVPAVALG
jgi:hypothetical protein